MATSLRLMRECDTSKQTSKEYSLVVKNRPIAVKSVSSSDSIKVKCRIASEDLPSYFCQLPAREDVRKSHFERRQSHLKCGFFCSRSSQYQEIEGATLDQKELIRTALHQEEEMISSHNSVPTVSPMQEQVIDRPASTSSAASRKDTRKAETIPGHLLLQHKRLSQCQKGRTLYNLLTKEHGTAVDSKDISKNVLDSPNDSSDQCIDRSKCDSVDVVVDTSVYPHKTKEEIVVRYWYAVLCTIWWVLEVTKQNSVKHFIPFRDCWKAGRSKLSLSNGEPGSRKDSWLALCNALPTIKTPKVKETSEVTTKPKLSRMYPSTKYTKTMEQIRHQKKLTVEQLENLSHYLDEQLSYSKKHSDLKSDQRTVLSADSPITGVKHRKDPLTVLKVKDQFELVESDQQQIVHEQLSSYQKNHTSVTERKLAGLQCSGNIWSDLQALRTISPMESSVKAKKKLIMNCKWIEDVLPTIPRCVRENYSCKVVVERLEDISKYMEQAPPEVMCQARLFRTLGHLRPWELMVPEVLNAVKIITSKVIFVKSDIFERWFCNHCQMYKNH